MDSYLNVSLESTTYMISHRKRRLLLLLSDNSWYLAEGMLMPLFAAVTQQMGGSIFDIASIYALYLVTLGIAIVIVGHFSDLYNKERLMLVGWFLHSLLTFCYMFMSTTSHFALIQIGLGISDALSTPTWYALYSKSDVQKYNGFFWGLSDGMEQICLGTGILLGGVIVYYTSLNNLFFIMGCLHLLGTFAVYQLMKKR